MKKNFSLFVILLLASVSVFGQREASVSTHAVENSDNLFSEIQSTTSADTIYPGSLDTCALTLYLAPDAGYVSGTNQFGDLEKAQHFQLTGTAVLSEVLVWFGVKEVGAGGDITAHIYQRGATGGPIGPALGSSEPVSLTDIDTSFTMPVFTSFQFSSPVSVPENFFVSIEVTAGAGDTVGIMTTVDECAVPGMRAWERWEPATEWDWVPLSNEDIGWGLEVDLAIGAVIELDFVGFSPKTGKPVLLNTYPNPAQSTINLHFELEHPSHTFIEILNVNGKVVGHIDLGYVTNGFHHLEIDLETLPSGIYFYSLNTDTQSSKGKFIVYD